MAPPNIEDKILKKARGRGRGWAFSAKDFAELAGRNTVDSALHRLVNRGDIRRVITGVYDLPLHSELLKRPVAPDVDQVARALARKFGWQIQPSGPSALNAVGLSTQVPSKYVYQSDGPKRAYRVGTTDLFFEHAALKDTRLKLYESGLLVQAIKSIGQGSVDAEALQRMRAWLPPALRPRVRKDTQIVTGWVHDVIRQVTEGSARG